MAAVARAAGVGAGLGGLGAATGLAAQGHAVTVLERAGQVGGKLGLLAVDGRAFDTGPSLVTLPQVYRDLFAATGTARGVGGPRAAGPAVAYRFADGTRLASRGPPRRCPARARRRAWAGAARSGRR